ncbi:MAG TPA: tRNA (adenosine(37)-N6)-threonylcarbamoyltransferase complex transferase subunit TsaD [Alphaproteobacteria bacterium]|nr:tRNA (adenosine(37)-N6)-threonylcarbamoyltransferase complex transferase subunit TsaD [Alphaproteobacteria bacterium]
MMVLGIETSCDETAAALVRGDRTVLAERLLSQLAEHRPYGGVVPEIAARAHLDHLDRLVAETMAEAGVEFAALDGIAATGGPGLIGGVIVGTMTGKAIAAVARKPFLAINHLEGHALSPRLVAELAFPYLLLLVSGGHCQLLAVEGVGRYRRLGTTVDDAAGEAFDKCAKLLGLGYPGGPAIEAAARAGNPKRFRLPRPMRGRPGCDFSFSGLKTAMRQTLDRLALDSAGRAPDARDLLDEKDLADLAASFQAAVADVLADRTARALELFRTRYPAGDTLVVAGGVAANGALRQRLDAVARERGFKFLAPPQRLCTDNAAMIAWAGIERLRLGLVDALDFAPRPRWPLDPAAAKSRGAGAKA